MSVSANLRADIVHIIWHPPQDSVGHRHPRYKPRVAAVTVQLLDPFEVDHGHDADLEIGSAWGRY